MKKENEGRIIKPEFKELDDKIVLVNGEGCDDDCEQYFDKTSHKYKCGWKETDNTWAFW